MRRVVTNYNKSLSFPSVFEEVEEHRELCRVRRYVTNECAEVFLKTSINSMLDFIRKLQRSKGSENFHDYHIWLEKFLLNKGHAVINVILEVRMSSRRLV